MARTKFKVGDKVRHFVFGMGEVVAIDRKAAFGIKVKFESQEEEVCFTSWGMVGNMNIPLLRVVSYE